MQVVSAFIYVGMDVFDYEPMSLLDHYALALYHCLVTASTVGYGDILMKDNDGVRLWVSAHILLSVSLLGESIHTFDLLRVERARELKRLDALNKKLDQQLLQNLNMRAAALRPDVQRDADGLTELEFVVGMCLELNMLDMELIRPFIDQFRKLDVDGNGRLAYSDLRAQASINTSNTAASQKVWLGGAAGWSSGCSSGLEQGVEQGLQRRDGKGLGWGSKGCG